MKVKGRFKFDSGSSILKLLTNGLVQEHTQLVV